MRHCFLGAKRARHRHERILSASRPLFWVFRSAHIFNMFYYTGSTFYYVFICFVFFILFTSCYYIV